MVGGRGGRVGVRVGGWCRVVGGGGGDVLTMFNTTITNLSLITLTLTLVSSPPLVTRKTLCNEVFRLLVHEPLNWHISMAYGNTFLLDV